MILQHKDEILYNKKKKITPKFLASKLLEEYE